MDILIPVSSPGIGVADIPAALVKARIPVHKWPQTENGALEDFLTMIREEAVTLHWENGRLTLHIMVAVPYIGYIDERMHELYEAYQLNLDSAHLGRVHYKSRPFEGSLGETMQRYWDGRIENGRTAIERGLREELDWCDTSLYELSKWQGSTWETSPPTPSDKRLGLTDIYHRYRMHCVIGPELYNPEGYIHLDAVKKKKEVFLWKDI
ncbi:MAG: hypothetical protein AAB365_01805 [Patescibacteria group bacterium]